MSSPRFERGAGALAFAAAVLTLFWTTRERAAPPTFDEAWYLENAYRFWHALTADGLAAFARAWAGAFRFKAPFASAAPLPFFAVFGLSYETALLSNVAALAVLAVSVHGLGRRLFSPAAGALAAALAMLMPLTAALSRTFFVETWLTAWTAAFLWRLAESDGLRAPRAPMGLGLTFAAGVLTKVTFPGIVAGPVLLTVWRRLKDPRGADLPGLERAAKSFALWAGVPAATWYAPNLTTVAAFTLAGWRGSVSAAYGSTDAWHPAVVGPYLTAIARDAVSWPMTALIASLAAARRKTLREPGFVFLATWVFPYLILTTSGYAKDARYVAPIVPACALLAAALLDAATAGRKARPVMLAAACLPLAYAFALQAFGSPPVPAPGAVLRVIPGRTQYGGPPPVRPELGQDRLVAELEARVPPGSVVVVGCEHGLLNANVLSAIAARDRRPLTFVHYGHMEGDFWRVLSRLVEKDATHVLFVDGLAAAELPPMVPAVDARLRAAALEGSVPLRAVGRWDGAGGLSYELWERTGPIRMVP